MWPQLRIQKLVLSGETSWSAVIGPSETRLNLSALQVHVAWDLRPGLKDVCVKFEVIPLKTRDMFSHLLFPAVWNADTGVTHLEPYKWSQLQRRDQSSLWVKKNRLSKIHSHPPILSDLSLGVLLRYSESSPLSISVKPLLSSFSTPIQVILPSVHFQNVWNEILLLSSYAWPNYHKFQIMVTPFQSPRGPLHTLLLCVFTLPWVGFSWRVVPKRTLKPFSQPRGSLPNVSSPFLPLPASTY